MSVFSICLDLFIYLAYNTALLCLSSKEDNSQMPFHTNFNPAGGFSGGFQGSDGGFTPPQRPKKDRKPRKAIGNGFTRVLINLLITLLFGAVYFYAKLPALNIQSEDFYLFVFLLCAVYCASAVFTSGFRGEGAKGYFHFVKKQCKIPFFLVIAMIGVVAVGTLTGWVVIRAASYSSLLPIETGKFTEEVDEISYDQIPMLDADSAGRLGSRKLGELADMVSQFEILPTYAQINYQGRPVRVTSLAYGDVIKWATNRGNGLPAYIIIDMVTQEANIVRLEEGMKYTIAEHFNRNLHRHLRFNFPTMMFDTPVFEIDEEGTPYWVCARIVKTIGLFGGTDIRGAVLVNAITGESKYYEEVPSWVDRVYNSDLIMQQYDYYGHLHNGFINSIFGQRDVTQTTDGYNYIAIGDDVYMYTGVTSVTSDQSNIGFLLSNQRTKETHFYSVAGATEASARASAESQVQQMRYQATFPLLLNIAHQPTYFMSLKGEDGLVKMFAMVNVEQYQIVATGQTLAECEKNYRAMLANSNLINDEEAEVTPSDQEVIEGKIAEIRSAVMSGNTYYFLRLDGSSVFYSVSAASNPLSVILNVGDEVTVTYRTGDEGSILNGTNVTAKGKSVKKAPVDNGNTADVPSGAANIAPDGSQTPEVAPTNPATPDAQSLPMQHAA